MTDNVSCPICKEAIGIGMSVCPRCGFKMPGATEAFKPVTAPLAGEEKKQQGSVPVLQVIKGPYAGQEFVMGEGDFTIGRDPSCDFFLNNTTVSRVHASIHVCADCANIVDEGSLNGTWVDGKIVDQAPLVSGSVVQIGSFEMMFKRKLAL